MYSRAGRVEGVKVSVSKSKSGDNGDEIMSLVMLRVGELGRRRGRGMWRTPMMTENGLGRYQMKAN